MFAPEAASRSAVLLSAAVSTSLSSSLAAVDPVLPGLRLLDTVMGAAVAVAFGYLLWPGARRLPTVARIDAAVSAASLYLDEAVKPDMPHPAPSLNTDHGDRCDD